jgi:beta-galactosidase
VSTNPADAAYLLHLIEFTRAQLSESVVLYTTDGGDEGYMIRGTFNGSIVYSVGDFGPGSDPMVSFDAMALFNPPGMQARFCSEYYSGWLTHWGETMANTSSAQLAAGMDQIYGLNGSVNLYMGHGGTNFMLFAGSNGGGQSIQPHITSYDYDSPLSESGAHGYGSDGADKFAAVLAVNAKWAAIDGQPAPPAELPGNPTTAYGAVSLTQWAPLLGAGTRAALCAYSLRNASVPPTFEAGWGQQWGLALYEASLPAWTTSGSQLSFNAYDRSYLLVNASVVGAPAYRPDGPFSVPLGTGARAGETLGLLVDTFGHINYGGSMLEAKGIQGGAVQVDGRAVSGWNVCGMPLYNQSLSGVPFAPLTSAAPLACAAGPVLLRGTFSIAQAPTDTFFASFRLTFGKVWINGNLLGRYWETQGPQQTLYVPAALLVQGVNEVVVLEMESAASAWNASVGAATVQFVAVPDFAAPPACTLAPSPVAGQDVVIYTCAGAATQAWTAPSSAGVSGPISPVSNPALCVTQGPGSDPQSGFPTARLEPCLAPLPANQTFSYLTASQALSNHQQNYVLDITSHDSFDGARVELYDGNGGPNQQWQFGTGGQITTLQDGRCLSTC